jgi:Kef-type K+ transport system membrane component KefB
MELVVALSSRNFDGASRFWSQRGDQRLRFISKTVHGLADYLVGFVMIAIAMMVGAGGAVAWIFLGLGVFAIVYSLFTDYRLGWKPVLTMPTHLALDAAFAAVMLVLPLVVAMPTPLVRISVVIGLMAAFLVATTRMD